LSSGAPGSAELYEAYQQIPDSGSFDQHAYNAGASQQQVLLTSPAAGLYYLRIHADGSSTYSLTATVQPLTLTQVKPNVVSNSGQATITLTGADFAPGNTVTLTSGSTSIPAAVVRYQNSSTLYATFNLAGAQAETYDVKVVSGTQTTTLPQAVNVTTGGGGQLSIQFVIPSDVRAGRIVTGELLYTNVGQSDLVAPIIDLSSPTGTLFTRDLTGQPDDSQDEFVAAGQQGPGGILEPGESVTVPLLVEAPSTGGQNMEIDASYIADTNTTPMAWAYVSDALNTFAVSDPLLPTVLSAMESSIGPTWGDYDAMLAANATLLPAAAGSPQDEDTLLQQEYNKVEASLSSSISGSVVTSSPLLELAGQHVEATNATDSSNYVAYILNDGSFVLPNLTPGSYSLQVEGAALVPPGLAAITVTSGIPVTGVTVNVVPEVVVAGTVQGAPMVSPFRTQPSPFSRVRQ
jgi:hypothetical protein